VVQAATKLVIEPIFEADFKECSYGFRPRRGATGALEAIRLTGGRGHRYVVEMDIRKYFDNIDHEKLMKLVEQRVSDRRVLKLLRRWLKAGVLEEGRVEGTDLGSPQGGVISPLLANIYLDVLDRIWERKCRHLGRLVRYADDAVVLCRSRADAEESLRRIGNIMERLSLTLHPDKTRIVDSQQPGQGFDFLGYRFEAGRRFVRKKSLRAVKDKVRAKTRRSRGDSLVRIIADLNPMLRGWFGYFKHAAPFQFRSLDGFVRRRLRAILRKQDKRPGPGRCKADHQRWPNAFFADQGLFTLETARELARHSR
jgi:RNA-directed DNA polymerase